MRAVVLPDPTDIQSIVADYFDSIPGLSQRIGDREKIVNNCVAPFAMLISAWSVVDSCGLPEGAIFATFVQDLVSQHPCKYLVGSLDVVQSTYRRCSITS